jgi:hypothetical protein
MVQIVVFVSPDASALARAVALFGRGAGDVLGPDAVEIAVEGDHAELHAAAKAATDGLPVDFAVTSSENRRKRLLIADMDSTIINVECLDELADFAGVKAQVSEITERAMRGELAFEGALRERVGMLTGLSVDALQSCYDDRVRLNPGAKTLVDHGRERRALRPGVGRLHLLHQPRGRGGGLPSQPGQHPDRRGRQADRSCRRSDPGQGGQAGRPARRDLGPGPDPRRRAGRGRRRQRPGDDRGRRPWASPIAPSRSSRPRPTPRSTTPTSPPCSTSRATRLRSSSRELPAPRRGGGLRHGRPAAGHRDRLSRRHDRGRSTFGITSPARSMPRWSARPIPRAR